MVRRHLRADGAVQGPLRSIGIAAPNGLGGIQGLIGVGEIALRRLVVCDGEDRRLRQGRSAEKKAPSPLIEGPGVGRCTDLRSGTRLQRTKVNGAAQSARAVDGRCGAMHDLDGMQKDRREKRKIEVAALGVGEALPVEQDRRLRGVGAPEGRGGETGVAVPADVKICSCLEKRGDGGGAGGPEGGRIKDRDASGGLLRSNGETARSDRKRGERRVPLNPAGIRLGGIGLKALCTHRQWAQTCSEEQDREEGNVDVVWSNHKIQKPSPQY